VSEWMRQAARLWPRPLSFGHPRRGAHHDLPAGLNDFEKRTDAVFGSASELALERTGLHSTLRWASSTCAASRALRTRGCI